MHLDCQINDKPWSGDVHPGTILMDFLRGEGWQGVKHGCETGDCGSCAVLVDGVPRNTCVMLAAQVQQRAVTTIEHIGVPENLHPIQDAFVNAAAIQCGYCTPSMILVALALLKKNPRPSENEVRDAFSGNLCRCTGYKKPVEAVLAAAESMQGGARV